MYFAFARLKVYMHSPDVPHAHDLWGKRVKSNCKALCKYLEGALADTFNKSTINHTYWLPRLPIVLWVCSKSRALVPDYMHLFALNAMASLFKKFINLHGFTQFEIGLTCFRPFSTILISSCIIQTLNSIYWILPLMKR